MLTTYVMYATRGDKVPTRQQYASGDVDLLDEDSVHRHQLKVWRSCGDSTGRRYGGAHRMLLECVRALMRHRCSQQ